MLAFIHELVSHSQLIDFAVLNVPFLHNHIPILNVSCVVVSDDIGRHEYKDDDEIPMEDILELDWKLLGQILVPLEEVPGFERAHDHDEQARKH